MSLTILCFCSVVPAALVGIALIESWSDKELLRIRMAQEHAARLLFEDMYKLVRTENQELIHKIQEMEQGK